MAQVGEDLHARAAAQRLPNRNTVARRSQLAGQHHAVHFAILDKKHITEQQDIAQQLQGRHGQARKRTSVEDERAATSCAGLCRAGLPQKAGAVRPAPAAPGRRGGM